MPDEPPAIPYVDRVLYVGADDHLEQWLIRFDQLLISLEQPVVDDSEVLALYDAGYSPDTAAVLVMTGQH